MFVIFVRFSRHTQDDTDPSMDNFPHLTDPRQQLLEQFKLELSDNRRLAGHWTTLHDFDTMNEPMQGRYDFFVWVKFCWNSTLEEFTRTLQTTYSRQGMAGRWDIIDAIGNDGLIPNEEIVAACAACRDV
jgi:hypothetical protein